MLRILEKLMIADGRIKLGVSDDFRLTDLHEAISRCLHLNKRLRIEVTSSLSAELLKMITRGDLDVALLKDTSTDTRSDLNSVAREMKGNRSPSVRFLSRLLRAEPLHWVSSRHIAIADLTEVPLVAFPEGCAYRMAALAALSMQTKPSFFSYTSASYDNGAANRSDVYANRGAEIWFEAKRLIEEKKMILPDDPVTGSR